MIIYHASQEQFLPSELLRFATLAEKAGFQAIHSSDHFHPWSARQGNSGFTFSWIAAAMQATSIPFGMICTSGQRYHPAIVAQAVATIGELFPGRFWMELGSGEAINECITGEGFPDKPTRKRRLYESAGIIRQLLDGQTVDHKGHVTVSKAKLYTRPAYRVPLIGAALTLETARWLPSWADGMITTAPTVDEAGKILEAFKSNGGDRKPTYFKLQLSYARDEGVAISGAYDQWRNNILPAELVNTFDTVEALDQAGEDVTQEQFLENLVVSSRVEKHVENIKAHLALGFDHIIVHNVNRHQEEFIEDFGPRIIGCS